MEPKNVRTAGSEDRSPQRATSPKPRVVSILSSGRSGSTLLDLLLNTHPDVWTLGEVQLLPHLVDDPEPWCGCGSTLRSCEFWAPLVDEPQVARPTFPIEQFRETRDAGRALRPRSLPGVLFGLESGASRSVAQGYGRANADLLDLIGSRATELTGKQPEWLVDASKDVYRLHALAESGRFDLRVIHLVKDPRAFAFSSLPGDTSRPRQRVARMSARWLVQNELYRRGRRTSDLGGSLTITYEQLASYPDQTLEAIAELLSLEDRFEPSRFRDVENHAIGGNPTRWRGEAIRLDERWKRELSPELARLCWRVAGLGARRYGYRRTPDRASAD